MRRLLLLALAASLTPACGAFDFTLEEATPEVVLPGDVDAFRAMVPLPADVIPPMTIKKALDDKPNAVYLESMTLALTQTVPRAFHMKIPFSFVNTLTFYVEPTKEGSGLARRKLAWMGLAPPGHEVPLEVNHHVDLLPYLLQGMRIVGELDARVPADDLSFVGRVRLGVDVF